MFAHHVLKDLGREAATMKQAPANEFDDLEEWAAQQDHAGALEATLPHIIRATKYHFGQIVENVMNIIEPSVVAENKRSGEDVVLFKSFSDYLIFPYKLLWFDWFAPNGKMAALIIGDTEVIPGGQVIRTFSYSPTMRSWVMYPDAIVLTPDVDFGYKSGVMPILSDRNLGEQYQRDREQINSLFLKILYAILLFINCRNVEVCKQHPSKVLQKKRKKKKLQPMFTYNILEIKDTRKRSVKRSVSEPSKGIQRYHEMPAQIRYYSPEKPLFGNPKNHGLFAFKSHWKGNPDKGIIIRDYKRKEGQHDQKLVRVRP